MTTTQTQNTQKMTELRDAYGRFIGIVPGWYFGNLEYGRRDRDGVLHVQGIARADRRTRTRVYEPEVTRWDA